MNKTLKKIEELQAQLDALKAQHEYESGLNVRVENGERYYIASAHGGVEGVFEHGDDFDNSHYNTGNYFLKEHNAETLDSWRQLNGQALRLAIELSDGEPERDWGDVRQRKYYPYFDHERKQWTISVFWKNEYLFTPHFVKKESCQRFVDWLNENRAEG